MKKWYKIQLEMEKRGPCKRGETWYLIESERLAILAAGELVKEIKKKFGETHDVGSPCSNPICIALKKLLEIK